MSLAYSATENRIADSEKIASSEKLFASVWGVIASDVPEGNVTQLSALLWRLTQELFPDTGQS
jgi:hypothetical protein